MLEKNGARPHFLIFYQRAETVLFRSEKSIMGNGAWPHFFGGLNAYSYSPTRNNFGNLDRL